MAGAARERVEQRRAIAGVAARQDVGRVGGPEQDPLAPQIRRPGIVGAGAVGEQPAPGERLGQARALLARGGGGEVAQPGEALRAARRAGRRRRRGEVEVGERDGSLPTTKRPASRASPRWRSPCDMVARHGDELERLAANA